MKVGLCLSGGGARGAFHMGVLKALDEKKVPISIIAGCSAGALVGSLYSAGVKPDEMISLAVSTRWFDFVKPALPNKGLIGMDYLRYILRKYIPFDDFKTLSIPLKVVATNLSAAKIRIFDSGPVIEAILASCSIPFLFKPVVIKQELYLDGGILLNLPAEVIRNDCDFLIGVSLMPVAPLSSDKMNSSFKLINRVLELSIHNSSQNQLSLCDLIITKLELSTYSRFDLKAAEELYVLGYEACLDQIVRIPKL